jgi:alpha-L-rhamnosidase
MLKFLRTLTNMNRMMKFFSVILLSFLMQNNLIAQISPVELTCEYVKDPAVVDVPQPRLAWINQAAPGDRGQRQTAYQIVVASQKNLLDNPDLWDSRKVNSDQSTSVPYKGKKLKSRQDCWWQVRVWDKDDKVSAWSEPARWHMGILKPEEWIAGWIGAPWQGEEALPKPPGPGDWPEKMPPPAPYFRKEFQVNNKIAKAVAYVTGLGYFEFYVNGEKIGEDVLVPNQTNYGKRPDLTEQNIPLEDNFREYKVMYLAYDITRELKQGINVVGSILGNGFYNAAKYWAGSYGTPRFFGQIHITYEDGKEEIVVSDATWKVSQGPILMDMVYYGEHYDARKEMPGWSTAGYNDSEWKNAVPRKTPEGKLVAHTPYPDRIMERISPVSIKKSYDNRHIVDFGKEISGWLRINEVEGPAGHKIEIKYISNSYSGDNSYMLKGGGPESYAARFNWFVFSGVEIINWPGELEMDDITAEAVNTWVEESAVFETSNPLFNQINTIWKRSQLDNMHGGLASDCPHRERAGYTGDGQVACVTVMHNFDARSFYHKWIQDMLGAQNPETGYVPNGAPWEPGCGGGVAWGAAINIMPWEFYLHYGDLDMLEENYEGMKGYIRYMETWVDEDGIMFSQAVGKDGKPLQWLNLGEWATPERDQMPPQDMVHTFYFWRCADITAKTAGILGRKKDAEKYSELAERTRNAFHAKFFNKNNGGYGPNGGNIFALRMGVPDDRYERVISALKENIRENDGHLDTGIFGTQFFFEILAEHGMQDLAYEAMNKRTAPGYGYWIEQGATTTREGWIHFGSHNHPMFGGGLVWFYRKLAGMQADPEMPGYRHIIFRPQPAGEMDFVKYLNNTARGKTGINWENTGKTFSMDVTIPVGSQATVYVPASAENNVTENGKKPDGNMVRFLRMEDGYAVFSVESGEYKFQSSGE